MEKQSAVSERIAARQEALATHARELAAELKPSVLAARAREDVKLAAVETREDVVASVRDIVGKVQAEARAFAKDPQGSLGRKEVRAALGALLGLVGLIAIVRMTKRWAA